MPRRPHALPLAGALATALLAAGPARAVQTCASRPSGVHRAYDAEGHLRSERHHDARGRIARERELDASGRVTRDDEVFEDGSRKAYAR